MQGNRPPSIDPTVGLRRSQTMRHPPAANVQIDQNVSKFIKFTDLRLIQIQMSNYGHRIQFIEIQEHLLRIYQVNLSNRM